MAITEKELDQLINSHLSMDLDGFVEVPDIDNQWQKIKDQLLKDKPAIKRTFSKQKKILAAAIILISIGSINFLYPNNANAVGGKIAEFFNHIVGKTTQNKTETYKSGIDPGVPKIQDIGDIFEKEVTLAEAQTLVHFKLATPSYLPNKASSSRVLLSSSGTDVYQITIDYILNENVIVFSQQFIANEISHGTLYDTDDTVIKDLLVNGSPASLFMSKNGINTLNWQSRGLLLQIKGKISEEEITKIANSVK